MNARDQLRQIIDARQGRLAAGEFPDREAALLALVGQIDRTLAQEPASWSGPCLGAPTALALCLNGSATNDGVGDSREWAETFLAGCRELEAARLVLRFADAREMRLAVDASGAFEAWLAGDRFPSLWLERADIAAWAASIAPDASKSLGRESGSGGKRVPVAHQLPYPADGEIAGVAVAQCRDVLAALVDIADHWGDRGDAPAVFDEHALISAIAGPRDVGPEETAAVLSALTLDAENAAWHAVLPGGPMAPLVRVAADRLALCRLALRTEPLFFLSRELRRRDSQRYHNAAHQREDAFRTDLYARFAESRFVTSPGRILLRRDDRRNRTDVDAAIFDRKTGTLALFELKAQDPFARTADELARQRENLSRAGRQVAAMLDWINRHGADEVLNRMDRATAKRFRVQRVLPFVLGRYLADGGGGRNGRVAWGSWGQVVRLLEDIAGNNPLLSLHDRLIGEARSVPVALPARIRLGETSITVRGGIVEGT